MKTIEPAKRLAQFSPEVSGKLSRIHLAWGRIGSATIWPASVEALRFSALVGTIHYSTLLEGNRLGILVAERAARKLLDPKTEAEIELVNYVDALKAVDEQFEDNGLEITESLVLKLHYELTKGLSTSEGHFMPHHEGAWRDGEAVVFDPLSQNVVHTGSPQREVQARMLGLIEWIREAETKPIDWPVHVVAGIVHHNITEIHPFADGNGRTARLMTSVLLQRHGQTPGRMFDFDRYYGQNRDAYLTALRTCQGGAGSHEQWIRYFLAGMADEYERVANEVDRLSHIGSTRGGDRIQLSETQQKALTDLAVQNRSEFSRKDYEHAGEVSKTSASNDLKKLAGAGVLDRIGSGSASKYRFSSSAITNPWTSDGRGRPRTWDGSRIEEELRKLVGDSDIFPTIDEFKDAGAVPLRAAIQRHGGATSWAKRLGISPPRKGPKKKPDIE